MALLLSRSSQHSSAKRSRVPRYAIYTSLVVTLALAGCGGGGGSSGIAPSSSSFTATVSGVALKGIIADGVVTANELDANGDVVRTVGSATTDSNGSYSLTIGSTYTGGPLDLVLTAGPKTTMICDVRPNCGPRTDSLSDPNYNGIVDFGETMTVPNLRMETLVAKASNGATLSANITPFTTMAAARARAMSPLNATAVQDANNVVSQLLGGLDIISLKPVNLTSSNAVTAATADERIYSILSAGVGELAFSPNGTGSVSTAVTKLDNSFDSGSILANNGNGNTFTLHEIVSAANDQLEQQGLYDSSGVLTAIEQDVTANSGRMITFTPNPNLASPALNKGKALVQALRTWGASIQSFGSQATAFGNELAIAKSISGPAVNSMPGSLAEALNQMFKTYSTNGGQSGTYSYLNSVNNSTGTVTITPGTTSTTLSIAGTEGENTVILTATAPTDALSGSSNISSLTVGMTGSVKSTASTSPGAASLLVNSGTTATATFSPSVSLAKATLSTIESALQTESFSINGRLAQLTGSNPVSFTGTLAAADQRVTFGANVGFNPTKARLTGTISDDTDSYPATLNASVSDAATYDPFAPTSATNALTGTLSAAMTVDLQNLPQAQLTYTAAVTGFGSTDTYTGSFNLILQSNGDTIIGSLNKFSGANMAGEKLVFNDLDGAQLTLSNPTGSADGAQGSITVGPETVATLQQLSDGLIKVTYEDGTFETLN